MKPVYPAPVPTWHNDTYDAIDPKRPEVSCKGKTVVVTGAGGGLGRAISKGFATAGASMVVLIGRNEARLAETKSELSAFSCEAVVTPADVTDAASLQKAAAAVRQWDILILNAGYFDAWTSIKDSNPDDWWRCFEVNVRGPYLTTQAFLKAQPGPDPAIINITAGFNFGPAANTPNLSGYVASKFAGQRVLEHVAVENPNVFVVNVQPGVVDTDMYTKFGRPPIEMDKPELPAHYLVWVTSPEARFLRGKSVFANWDAKEVMAMKDEITNGALLTTGVVGWPFEKTMSSLQ